MLDTTPPLALCRVVLGSAQVNRFRDIVGQPNVLLFVGLALIVLGIALMAAIAVLRIKPSTNVGHAIVMVICVVFAGGLILGINELVRLAVGFFALSIVVTVPVLIVVSIVSQLMVVPPN
jgi:hypothetical protein